MVIFKIRQRQLHAGLLLEIRTEGREVMFRKRMAARSDGSQLRQLVQADRGSHIGQVEFATQHVHVHAVEAGARDALQAILLREARFIFVVQHQTTAFGGGEVLVGLETEGNEIAEAADALAFPHGTDGLRRIFHHAQIVALGDVIQPVPVHRQTGKIDRDDGLGARRNCGLDLVQIDIARDRVDVRKHGRCADFKDDAGCCHPGNRA